jgi:hypothetical protein
MGDILNIELLAQAFREFLGDDASDHVGRPRRRKRHDHLDRVRRITGSRFFRCSVLRKAGTRKHKGCGKDQSADDRLHMFLPGFFGNAIIAPRPWAAAKPARATRRDRAIHVIGCFQRAR